MAGSLRSFLPLLLYCWLKEHVPCLIGPTFRLVRIFFTPPPINTISVISFSAELPRVFVIVRAHLIYRGFAGMGEAAPPFFPLYPL